MGASRTCATRIGGAARALSVGIMLAIGAGGVAGTGTPAAAQDRVVCLWDSLPPLMQLRLELAARLNEGLPNTLIERLGEARLRDILSGCGLGFEAADLAVLARYWVTRAEVEVQRDALRHVGVSRVVADAALASAARPDARRAYAEAMMSAGDADGESAVGAAIFAAISVVDTTTDGLSEEAKQALAIYYAASILADGLVDGALPPIEDGADVSLGEGWRDPDAPAVEN